MITLFNLTLLALILAELIKGLSANGTPPVLQKFSWQMDLAYLMWSIIGFIRFIAVIALICIIWYLPTQSYISAALSGLALGLIWWGVYWVFNRFWVGKYKFLPITQKVFLPAKDNAVDPNVQVVGIDVNGEQKAYPVAMLFYHHQITDVIARQPIWATYCGLCRSARIYDIEIDGQALDFTLVGAISFNAVFRDHQTGSWWRQETGEAAKGPKQGTQLADIPFEQMSLQNWLAKYPDSTVLQYDPLFQKKYDFITRLLNYEASLPGWHRQDTPPLIVGVQIGDVARAYDLNELQKRAMIQDVVADSPLLIYSHADESGAFVYERIVDGQVLDFTLDKDVMIDSQTQSKWDQFGRCVSGPFKGQSLNTVQSYKQFLRAWITFHPNTTFFEF